MKKSLSTTSIQLVVLVSSFAVLFSHTIIALVEDWSTNPNYSHGFLIPLIAVFMIWQKREEISPASFKQSNWGLVVIALGMMLHIVARLGAELFTMRLAIVVTLFGLSLYFMGKEITRKTAIPIAYLLFMIPIPAILLNKITFPLQIFSSRMAEEVIQFMGISVLREGNILRLTNATLEVVDACSGIRSLLSLLALSAAFAYLSDHSRINKWVLFVSAIPIAILVNIIRLSLTAGLASYFGEKVAEGFLHEFSGMLIYILALIMLAGVHVILLKMRRKSV
jgi:exosortase